MSEEGSTGSGTNGASPEARTRRRRRRRARRGEGLGFAALLPHILTTANIAGGFYAIVAASDGHFGRACLAIILAAVADNLDGRVARMANVTSRFGVEYDSIADTVSFAVAPAILAYHAGHLNDLGWTGWVMAFIFTACAALRLARFNVTPGRYAGRFEGLPSPAGAGMIVGSTLFGLLLTEQLGLAPRIPATLLGLGVVAVGLLMVTQIPYHSFKNLRIGQGYRAVVLLVMGFAVILLVPEITLFLIGIVYVSSGPIEWIWRRQTGRALVPLEVSEGTPEEPAEGTL